MNFLAHLLLSYPNGDEMTGNFMGDFVKGRKYLDYPQSIRQGILLHRAIDDFTDNNATAKELVTSLRPIYGRYAAVISDIVFDHVLAKNFTKYCDLNLNAFSEYSYTVLNDRKEVLPERVAFILDRIRESGRLQMYATLNGIENSINIMAQHTSLPNNTPALIDYLKANNSFVLGLFQSFFPELQHFVSNKRSELSKPLL